MLLWMFLACLVSSSVSIDNRSTWKNDRNGTIEDAVLSENSRNFDDGTEKETSNDDSTLKKWDDHVGLTLDDQSFEQTENQVVDPVWIPVLDSNNEERQFPFNLFGGGLGDITTYSVINPFQQSARRFALSPQLQRPTQQTILPSNSPSNLASKPYYNDLTNLVRFVTQNGRMPTTTEYLLSRLAAPPSG